MMREKYQQGQTLIDAIAALGIISIIISAIAMLVTTTVNSAKFNQYNTLASQYAQQGTEVVQQIRDKNYTSFTTYNGTYCLAKGQTTLGSAAPGGCTTQNVDNIFVRSVTIQQAPGCGANVAQVSIIVAFADGKCQAGTYCHKQTVTTCLSTVDPVQAP